METQKRTQETSLIAYREIKSNGLLSESRLRTFWAIVKLGGCTSAEAFRLLQDHSPDLQISSVRARITELSDRGVIEESHKRPCGVTGNLAIVWTGTGELPNGYVEEKKNHDRELLKQAVSTAGNGDPHRAPRWSHVRGVFRLGSTSASRLCRRFNVDPDEMIGGCDSCGSSYVVDYELCECDPEAEQ